MPSVSRKSTRYVAAQWKHSNFLGYRLVKPGSTVRVIAHSLLTPLSRDRSKCYVVSPATVGKRRATRPTKSRTITSLLAAVGAGFAVPAIIGAPAAVAQPDIVCEPGQVVIDGQCNVPDTNANNVPAPQDGTGGPGMDSGGSRMLG